MNPALLAQVAGYLVTYGPAAFDLIQKLWIGIDTIRQNHKRPPTDEELAALVAEARANHDSLPRPE